jgi:Leucine-rich repeat (LRR) protein
LNQNLLIKKYGFSIDSDEIDLSEKNIDHIDINTFKGYNKLEILYLDNNELSKLEDGLFIHISNLKELWLESNNIISIDKNTFNGLNKLEKVCLNANPISLWMPSRMVELVTNQNCYIISNKNCIKHSKIYKSFFLIK